MIGPGTNDEILIEILCTRSNEKINLIRVSFTVVLFGPTFILCDDFDIWCFYLKNYELQFLVFTSYIARAKLPTFREQ